MKTKKILWAVLFLLLFVLIAAGLFINRLSNNPIPDYNESIKLERLTEEVQVYRDSFAIPHVYAQNEHDLYLAVGYLMAQDRLWQMDLLRRVTQGRLSEVLSNDLVEVDQLMRSLQMTKKSSAIFDSANKPLRECVLAFCDGVNQFINNNQNKLPFEFKLLGYQPEEWLPVHSINLIGYMAWDLSTGWPNELTLMKLKNKLNEEKFNMLLPDIPGQSSSIYSEFSLDQSEAEVLTALQKVTMKLDDLGLDVFRGSNNWVIDGTKSKTGKPLLANDMHLGLNIPGVWYQMHQVIPGQLNVTGVVLPGQPMIIAGHNDNIAWGFTNVMTDGLDFYEETVNPENPDEYLLDGEWKAFTMKEEIILNKSGDTIRMVNKFTHRGPVVTSIKAIPGKTISMSWIGIMPSNELLTVYRLNRAANWDEFKDAIRTFVSVNQNVVYADTEGNIGLHSTIGLPIREATGVGVYPGETSKYDWKGLVPFEELPFTFNPDCGFISSANNKTVKDDYPYYISSWFDLPYRQDRIQELLKEKDQLSIKDYIRFHADQRSKMAEKMLPVFLHELNQIESVKDSYPEILEQLKAWDYNLSRESVDATIFEFLYFSIFENLVADEIGADLFEEVSGKKIMIKNFMENFLKNTDSPWCDNISSNDKKETFADVMEISFSEALNRIEEQMGPDYNDWMWGDIHTLTLQHPLASAKIIAKVFGLNRGPYSVGGSHHTVCPYSYNYMDPSSVNHGASHRHIFDLSNWDNSLTVIPTGNSGLPASDHYCDQTELYVNNQYHSDYVSKDKIIANAKYSMSFIK
ncbi:MAG: penicillin acylase family protein [Bacteroidetes bacterium]|jgi:penicillin G amidase|nr:penicillin acylase family protein [Bacteroidota bacterium]MBT4398763.1 penicillin acylase family protein [Bacteroidota bacterium]MBT7094797.1 penicillin acylase family protein [Bacteroidota bacterium]